MLRLTLLTSAVASATFVGTLVFAPAVIDVGERLGFRQAQVGRASAPPEMTIDGECKSAFQKIVAALRHKECLP